jgi:hypothetical protein
VGSWGLAIPTMLNTREFSVGGYTGEGLGSTTDTVYWAENTQHFQFEITSDFVLKLNTCCFRKHAIVIRVSRIGHAVPGKSAIVNHP